MIKRPEGFKPAGSGQTVTTRKPHPLTKPRRQTAPPAATPERPASHPRVFSPEVRKERESARVKNIVEALAREHANEFSGMQAYDPSTHANEFSGLDGQNAANPVAAPSEAAPTETAAAQPAKDESKKLPANMGTGDKLLGQGLAGPEVKALQELLNGHGFKLDADGIFGPKTKKALEEFQAKQKLDGKPIKVDGIVGPETRKALSQSAHANEFAGTQASNPNAHANEFAGVQSTTKPAASESLTKPNNSAKLPAASAPAADAAPATMTA